MLPVSVVRRGTTSTPTPPVYLQAGPLSARFEPDGVFLRHIALGEHEILRGIYVAVRDQNWNTITPVVTRIDIQTTDETFAIDVDVRCHEREVDFTWRGTITGQADGTIHYKMDGTAQSSFWRNRIGILVLHPPSAVAGKPAIVEAPDGSTSTGHFPTSISPHQPFFNIQAITHEVVPGVSAEVRFAGEVFEMEDQRNWTDASYKTYSTPLELPFPVLVEEGTQVNQSIEIRLHGEIPDGVSTPPSQSVALAPDDLPPVKIPPIGLCMASDASDLADREIQRLRQLNLGHLRVEIHLNDTAHVELINHAIRQSRALGVPLQVALFLEAGCEQKLADAVAELASAEINIADWLIFGETEKVADRKWVEMARPAISAHFPNAQIASGTNAYFTELNRERPDTDLLDAICYAINPQVHAFDDHSLVETLEAQSWTVESARQFADGREIVVGPITLRPRFNPNATAPESDAGSGSLPSSVDPRQISLFGAGWTLGSLKYISQSAVRRGTWFETVGWKGVMERESGSRNPELFPSLPGAVFPLYHVFADFGEFAGGEIVPWQSTDPLRVDGCMLQANGKRAILIANLTPDEQQIDVPLPDDMPQPGIRILDETNAELATTDPDAFRAGSFGTIEPQNGVIPVTLKPFAFARISDIPQN
ncbi:MAG: hypothetical protein EA415_13500 [Sphaerobacteraceae bacterium]|nr:MAG: hypothetical protein EA415_13500 [Sphaerobacteraceae bacterium]